jgi:hypothetical protein
MTSFYLITTFVILLACAEAADKATQVNDIYLTKEKQLQGRVDWLVKDLEAWDTMCEWWTSVEFRTILEGNQQSKPSVHHYRADGHVRKTQRMVRYTLSLFLYVFCINLFIMLDSMFHKKSIGI